VGCAEIKAYRHQPYNELSVALAPIDCAPLHLPSKARTMRSNRSRLLRPRAERTDQLRVLLEAPGDHMRELCPSSKKKKPRCCAESGASQRSLPSTLESASTPRIVTPSWRAGCHLAATCRPKVAASPGSSPTCCSFLRPYLAGALPFLLECLIEQQDDCTRDRSDPGSMCGCEGAYGAASDARDGGLPRRRRLLM
jgi:hypothetical protein